ncbi:MAG: acetylxylan esterase [Planctomycetes bacterium]|nr:acetylxylan esterase [Planctomycetota bacterium]
MPYSGDDYLKLLDLTGEGAPQKYNEMLCEYHRLYGERRTLPDYRSMRSEEVKAVLAEIRSKLTRALGVLPHPDGDPPVLQSAGSFERPGYSVERVYFEASPRRPVTGLVYRPIPAPEGKTPGVLIVHGHSGLGKAQPATQIRSIGLVKRGFTVLAVDTAGLNERKALGHTSIPLFASGVTPQALLLHDNMRALDVLCALPGVDGARIGLTGSSGGGTQTMYLAALDERVAASAPTAAVNAFEDHVAHSSSYYCSCELVPGMARFCDIGDVLALTAPRAVLVLMGTRDRTFPAKGARESFLRALDAYGALGAGEAIEKYEAYAPHAYCHSMRQAMYAFFERHLVNAETALPEEYPPAHEDPGGSEINVLASVPRLMDDVETVVERAAAEGRSALRKTESAAQKPGPAAVPRLKQVFAEARPGLMGEPLVQPGCPLVLARAERTFGAVTADCFVIESECGILVPAFVASMPHTPAAAPIVVYLSHEGKDAVFFHRRARDLFDAGYRVAGLDVRGTGETAYAYYTEEERAVHGSIMCGRALFDGRALDLSSFLRIVSPDAPAALWATDAFSMYSILSAADSPAAAGLVLENALAGLVSERGFPENAFDHLFVPGILGVLDVPQLLALVSPKPVLAVNPVDGRGAPLSADAATEAFGWTSAVSPEGTFAVEAGLDGPASRARVLKFLEGALPR